jgi:uracil DNA glycosylase superfamily protein
MNRLEKLRKSFYPDCITTLFVGESAPASGRFFYSSNSSLFRAMKRVFGDRESFLEDFKRNGFYLDDLVLTPINKMERRERSSRRQEAVPELAKRLVEYKPEAVVVVMRAILPKVRQAMQIAGMSYEPFCVPHPAFGNWPRFSNAMKEIIDDLPVADGSK